MSGYSVAEAKADYREMISEDGEEIALRRAGADYQPVMARFLKDGDEPLPGIGDQTTRRLVVLAEMVEAKGWPLPLLPKQDRILWDGRALVILHVNDTVRRVAGVLIAYELTVAGA